jgi:hypothetical protein
MARVPAFARAIAGRWRNVEMDTWDNDFLDLVEEAHIMFESDSQGERVFGALIGFLDVRYGPRDGSPSAEFSWEARTRRTQPAAADGPLSETPAVSSATSTSITAMNPPSVPK